MKIEADLIRLMSKIKVNSKRIIKDNKNKKFNKTRLLNKVYNDYNIYILNIFSIRKIYLLINKLRIREQLNSNNK